MPPPFDFGDDEVSIRHLPDVSNASFSFQIPAGLSQGDLLLGDNDPDFFQDVGDTPRIASTSLTLAELTPNANIERTSRACILIPQAHVSDKQHDPMLKKIPLGINKVVRSRLPTTAKKITRAHAGEASPAVARLRALKTELEMLNKDGMDATAPHAIAGEPQDQAQGSKLPKATQRKHTVISGGITKNRSKNIPSKTTFARSITSAPQYHPSPQPLEPTHVTPPDDCEDQNFDATFCSATNDGVAERLVMYSQKFMSSFGLSTVSNVLPEPKFEATSSLTAVPESTAIDPNNILTNDAPFTLSQLSPRRPSSPLQSATAPMSPMRPSSKRPVSALSSDHHASKKGKATAGPVTKHTARPQTNKDVLRKPPAGIISSSDDQSRSRSLRSVHATTVTKKPKATNRQASKSASHHVLSAPHDQDAPERTDVTRSSHPSSSALRHSQADSDHPAKHSASQQVEEPSRTASLSGPLIPRNSSHVSNAPANPTKPIEFKFEVDMRIEARRAASVKEGSVTMVKPRPQFNAVPDFKTLHAQHEERIAHRKENIHPTIPLPLELHTIERAKEREKFDLMMKEKEREMERVMEQRRKEREENEEREVRELRKKAVPRAHEVPEWYSEAPRRKTKAVVRD